jgi:type II secretory pathway pseudopilin PulG
MPSSALVVAGLLSIACAVGLLVAVRMVRRDVASARRLLHRVIVAVEEAERIDAARRQLVDGVGLARDGASGVNRVVRRSGSAIAGIPYAILDGIGRMRRSDPT